MAVRLSHEIHRKFLEPPATNDLVKALLILAAQESPYTDKLDTEPLWARHKVRVRWTGLHRSTSMLGNLVLGRDRLDALHGELRLVFFVRMWRALLRRH